MKAAYSLTLSLLTSFLVFAQSGNSIELSSQLPGKYNLQSGQISYTISGEATGTATLYFDRNGWRELLIKEITFEHFGMKTTERTLELKDGDFYYQVNLESKKGSKKTSKSWSQLLSYKDRNEVVESVLLHQGGIKQSDTTLLDYSVSVWNYENGAIRTIWELDGIKMKEVKSVAGIDYEMTCMAFEENKSIPEDMFKLPEGIVWVD